MGEGASSDSPIHFSYREWQREGLESRVKTKFLCLECDMPLDWIELPNGLYRLFCGQISCKADHRGAEVDCRMSDDVNSAYDLLKQRHERAKERVKA